MDFKINLQGFRQAVIGAGKGTLEDFENLIQLNHGTKGDVVIASFRIFDHNFFVFQYFGWFLKKWSHFVSVRQH